MSFCSDLTTDALNVCARNVNDDQEMEKLVRQKVRVHLLTPQDPTYKLNRFTTILAVRLCEYDWNDLLVACQLQWCLQQASR